MYSLSSVVVFVAVMALLFVLFRRSAEKVSPGTADPADPVPADPNDAAQGSEE